MPGLFHPRSDGPVSSRPAGSESIISVRAPSAAPGFASLEGGEVVPSRGRGPGGLGGVVPTVARNTDFRIFEDCLLKTAAGFAAKAVSDPFPMMGNAMAAALTGINVSGSATVTLTIQGSVNRRVWQDLFSVALTAFGYAEGSATAVKYAWLRAHRARGRVLGHW